MSLLLKFQPKLYLSGAMVIGFMQVIDGVFALSGYRSSITTAFSLLELVWFLVSLLYFLAFTKQMLKPIIPLMYIAYSIFSWLYASYLLSQKTVGDVLQLPTWFMVFATGFGLIYCASAFYFYKKYFLKCA